MSVIPAFTQFSLNIRGVLDPKSGHAKLDWLKWLIREYKPDMLHLQEHHCYSMKDVMKIFRKLNCKIMGVSLAPHKGSYAGVLTLIPKNSKLNDLVEEHTVSADGRYAMLRIKTDTEFQHVLNIYAPAEGKSAREFFFSELANAPCMNETSMTAVGDWNFVLDRLDRVNVNGHVDPTPHPLSEQFLDDAELIDLLRYYDGEIVTMTHSAPSQGRWARLDRWYTQPDLLDRSSVLPTISAAAVSDHDVIRLQYGNPYQSEKPTRPIYRMSVALIKQLGIHKSLVRETTTRLLDKHAKLIDNEQDPAKVLKLYDQCKLEIREFYQRCDTKHIKARKFKLRAAIKLADFDIGPNAPRLSKQITDKEKAKEIIKQAQRRVIENIKLKSAFNWTRDSEHSNKLFFRTTKQRINCAGMPNVIFGNLEAANHFQNKILVGMSFAKTFRKRLPEPEHLTTVITAIKQSQSPGRRQFTQGSKDWINYFMDIKARNLDENENPADDWLIKAITALKMYKAPGPDGLPNEFYYLLREVPSLIRILKKTYEMSLKLGTLPETMRETYFKLLYKKGSFTAHEIETGALHNSPADPRLLGNWRPIALIPCDAKILSSYIANNLKSSMDDVSTRAQSAFVPGRTIMDNIMLVLQAIHHHMTTKKGAAMVFLDFAHAYDYISQEYILKVLEALDFPSPLLNAIKMMMKDQSGRVIVNNDLTHKFKVMNGGKQGDPLFPLIYIAALEGLYALIDTHPSFQGIKIPGSNKYLKYVGYADDTAIALGKKSEKEALTAILSTFEKASGNQIKQAKSYIIWLGSWIATTTPIYGIPPLKEGDTERYLGVNIGHHLHQIDQWGNTITKLNDIFKYWNQLNLTILGRTLLINSRMLSQIWYKGAVTVPTPKQVKQLDSAVNTYFRKGKRNNTVSAATRILPPRCGGLGQLHLPTQLHLLRIKWVLKFSSGEAPMWALYWAENVRKFQELHNTDTDLKVLAINWKAQRATVKNKLFPFMVEAYKSWHAMEFEMPTHTFENAASQPLLDNKYILDENSNLPLRSTDDSRAITSHLSSLQIGMFFREAEDYEGDYSPQNPNTWRFLPRDPDEMNAFTGLEGDEQVWAQLFALIPVHILETMTTGSVWTPSGWAATELESEDPNETSPIGDIYYIITPLKNRKLSLLYFREEDDTLVYDSPSNHSWGDWETELLPNLRPLEVTCISGLPRVLGWADQVNGPNSFVVPNTPQNKQIVSTLETIISSKTYTKFESGAFETLRREKPEFGALNKKLRAINSRPLPFLDRWTPSEQEINKHNDDIAEKKKPPGSICQIDWQRRMQIITNCPFVGAKYRQLIYWITTGTLCTGKQLQHHSPRGKCPHCTETATWQHMFFTCYKTKEVWTQIDQIGFQHWGAGVYTPLTQNEIPVILTQYIPFKLYQLSALWGLWVHWCKYFHDPENFSYEDKWDWTDTIIVNTRDQLRMRVKEAHSAVQWQKIVSERRMHMKDKQATSAAAKAPEKEFLLIHSQSINTNSENININDKTPLEIQEWFGNQYIIKLDLRDGPNPRMKFNFLPWDVYTRPPDHDYPSDYGAGHWVILPRHCLDDY